MALSERAVKWLQQANILARGSKGMLLAEAVIAAGVFTLVGSAVMVGVATTHRSGNSTEGQSFAENLARNQMESVFNQAYQLPPSAYPAVTTPAGYTITAEAIEEVPGDTNIERITVTVNRSGQDVLILETLRVKN